MLSSWDVWTVCNPYGKVMQCVIPADSYGVLQYSSQGTDHFKSILKVQTICNPH
jgi:hypothetical protein